MELDLNQQINQLEKCNKALEEENLKLRRIILLRNKIIEYEYHLPTMKKTLESLLSEADLAPDLKPMKYYTGTETIYCK